jgi:CHAT domain-containing protein/predicted negative regulator of RcsB-dependent stress response
MNSTKYNLTISAATFLLILTLGAAIFAQTGEEKSAAANKTYDEAIALFQQGTADSRRAAQDKFRAAADLFVAAENPQKQAVSMVFQGLIADGFGEKNAALEIYGQALMIFRSIADKGWEATTLSNMGKVYSNLGEKRKALDFYNQSLPLARAAGKKFQEGVVLLNIGEVHSSLGENRKALDFYAQALPIFAELNDAKSAAITISNIGLVYSELGDPRQALKYYDLALPLLRKVGDKETEAVTLANIGSIYSDLGEMQKALKYLNESLILARTVGDKSQEARTLTGIGEIYANLGERQKALEHFNQALPLTRASSDRSQEAVILSNIGAIYDALGDPNQALKFYNQSLPISNAVGNKRQEAITLTNIGKIYRNLGEPRKALSHYAAALALSRLIGDKNGEALTLINMGAAHFSLGDIPQSLKFYNESLPLLRAVGNKRAEAITLSNIGAAHHDLGDKPKALEYFQQSLVISKSIGDKEAQATTLGGLMFCWNNLKNSRFAAFYGKQSVNLLQELRQNINTLDKETQKTYLKSIAVNYRQLADILIAGGRIAEAEEVLAMLKEEEFFAYLRRDDKVAADLKGKISLSADEKKAFKDYEKFSDDITRTAQEFGALEKKKNDLPLGETLAAADQQIYDALKAKYDAAVVVFDKFLNDLKVKFGTNDKRVAGIESDTQGILKRLNEPRTVIISTIVGEDRLNLIVTTADTQRAHTIDIKAADLNKLVSDFREAVKNPEVDPRPLGKKLFDILFPAALQKDLDGIKADTLVWSLDGTLRYAPLAALWDGENYLAERYTNAVLTLASRDKINASATTDRAKWLALGVGVSKAANVKNDDGTTTGFDALAAVPQELCSVIADPKKKEFCDALGKQQTGVIGGLLLPDDEFTLTNFENNLGKVSVIHIASHFSLNAGDETDSYLLLGGGAERRFSLVSLKKTRLDKVELLTLSACNTAMTSGANSSGVEIEGFGALAQYQGAKTVLATLWAVADDSTRDLMTEFYRELEDNPKTGKAEALRQAQIKLINGKNKSEQTAETRRSEAVRFGAGASNFPKFTKDENAPFAHPFYWSPFVLSGNWR